MKKLIIAIIAIVVMSSNVLAQRVTRSAATDYDHLTTAQMNGVEGNALIASRGAIAEGLVIWNSDTKTLWGYDATGGVWVDQGGGGGSDDDITGVTFDGTTLTVTEGATSFGGDISSVVSQARVKAGVDAEYPNLDTDSTDDFDGNYNSLTNLPTLFDGAFSSLTGVPTGLADGDDDTTYTAGAGLTLTGTVFSLTNAGSDDQTAAEVSYDNTTSGLTATTTQAAIDEIAASGGSDDDITSATLSAANVLTINEGTTAVTVDLSSLAGDGDLWSDPVDSNIIPDGAFTRQLGSAANPFQLIYSDDIDLTSLNPLIKFSDTNNPNNERFFFGSENNTPNAYFNFQDDVSGSISFYTINATGTPVDDEDLTTKKYVDDQITAAGGGESTTVSDTAELDLTLTGVDITGAIVASSIDETKLDASTNASLDLADSAIQTTDIDTFAELNAIVADADLTNTDNQNIQNLAINTTTNILTVGIEDGTSQTVDLSYLDNSGAITTLQTDVDQNEADADAAIALKEDAANKSTDGTLAGNSDIHFPTEQAVKTYVDNNVKSTHLSFVPESVNDVELNDTNVIGPQGQSISNQVTGSINVILGDLISVDKWFGVHAPYNLTDIVSAEVEAGFIFQGKLNDGTLLQPTDDCIQWTDNEEVFFTRRDATTYFVRGNFEKCFVPAPTVNFFQEGDGTEANPTADIADAIANGESGAVNGTVYNPLTLADLEAAAIAEYGAGTTVDATTYEITPSNGATTNLVGWFDETLNDQKFVTAFELLTNTFTEVTPDQQYVWDFGENHILTADVTLNGNWTKTIAGQTVFWEPTDAGNSTWEVNWTFDASTETASWDGVVAWSEMRGHIELNPNVDTTFEFTEGTETGVVINQRFGQSGTAPGPFTYSGAASVLESVSLTLRQTDIRTMQITGSNNQGNRMRLLPSLRMRWPVKAYYLNGGNNFVDAIDSQGTTYTVESDIRDYPF